ncbi:MAG: hypothetical protein ACYCU7_04620 [Acidimicrobiales bacterium]
MALVQQMDDLDRTTHRPSAGSRQGSGAREGDEAATAQGEVILRALDQLAEALEENSRDHEMMLRRVQQLRQARASGMSWEDILSKEEGMGTMQLMSQMLGRLSAASGTLRKEMVYGLRDEGVSVPMIARLFGVTHQRVSNLLRRSGS